MTESVWSIVILILIGLNAYGAYLMRNAAIDKGYSDEIHPWAVCFWLGLFGYLYIIALPDKIVQEQNKIIIDMMKEEK